MPYDREAAVTNFLLTELKVRTVRSRVPETTLPLRQIYREFVCENVVPVGRGKIGLACLFITLIKQRNVL